MDNRSWIIFFFVYLSFFSRGDYYQDTLITKCGDCYKTSLQVFSVGSRSFGSLLYIDFYNGWICALSVSRKPSSNAMSKLPPYYHRKSITYCLLKILKHLSSSSAENRYSYFLYGFHITLKWMHLFFLYEAPLSVVFSFFTHSLCLDKEEKRKRKVNIGHLPLCMCKRKRPSYHFFTLWAYNGALPRPGVR